MTAIRMRRSATSTVFRNATPLVAVLLIATARQAAADSPAPTATDRIEITKTASSWDNLSELFLGATPAEPFGQGSVFVMRGELRNKSERPVGYVVLRYELLDDKGKVLHDLEGYNRHAEGMRPDEEGNVHPETVKSIPAGGSDSYRMVFFHDEVPRFSSQRVRVVEVHDEGEAAAAAKLDTKAPAGKPDNAKAAAPASK